MPSNPDGMGPPPGDPYLTAPERRLQNPGGDALGVLCGRHIVGTHSSKSFHGPRMGASRMTRKRPTTAAKPAPLPPRGRPNRARSSRVAAAGQGRAGPIRAKELVSRIGPSRGRRVTAEILAFGGACPTNGWRSEARRVAPRCRTPSRSGSSGALGHHLIAVDAPVVDAHPQPDPSWQVRHGDAITVMGCPSSCSTTRGRTAARPAPHCAVVEQRNVVPPRSGTGRDVKRG